MFLKIIFIYLFFSTLCLIANYRLKKGNLAGISNFQCFNPVKWFSVGIGFVLKFLFPWWIFEQYVLRFYDADCAPCKKAGKCIAGDSPCGCDFYAKAWSPVEKCSNGNWGPIIWSKKEYMQLRQDYPIKIKIER